MKTFGLTGGIGMGKSTAAAFLQKHGVPLVDTDILAREVVAPGQSATADVKARFGAAMFNDAGELRRDELARLVFTDATARRDLEAIVHPRIRARWINEVERWRGEGRALGVVVIPLLFETGSEKHFDAAICVACSAETQRRRMAERGWSPEQIRGRIEAQWPVEKKMGRADYVIWTEGSLETHREQLERIFE